MWEISVFGTFRVTITAIDFVVAHCCDVVAAAEVVVLDVQLCRSCRRFCTGAIFFELGPLLCLAWAYAPHRVAPTSNTLTDDDIDLEFLRGFQGEIWPKWCNRHVNRVLT